ncbi:MAG: FAD-dependent oxidoreductase [Clostridia bacterium]|nr:FAD-dependent oxidoreductase [Clostridia bacterium]
MQKYDVVIIGGGPAGLAAAIYAARAKLTTLVLEKDEAGGRILGSREIDNYPGYFGDVSGPVLMAKWREHALYCGAEIVQETAESLDLASEIKTINTEENTYEAAAVILCPGVPKENSLKGEKTFMGRGVSYCVNCDATFFEGLSTAVAVYNDHGMEEAIFLTRFAKEVYVTIPFNKSDEKVSEELLEEAQANNKIKLLWHTNIIEIQGDAMVNKAIIQNMENNEISGLEVNGVFLFPELTASTAFLAGQVELDSKGYIKVSEKMETNLAGVYAAGDGTHKFLRQVVTAASDGAIAAVAAEKYISKLKK